MIHSTLCKIIPTQFNKKSGESLNCNSIEGKSETKNLIWFHKKYGSWDLPSKKPLSLTNQTFKRANIVHFHYTFPFPNLQTIKISTNQQLTI